MVIRNGVNHVLRALPLFVALEILGHVVKVILFMGRRQFKDAFGFRDQYLGSLNFFPTRFIHARPRRCAPPHFGNLVVFRNGAAAAALWD